MKDELFSQLVEIVSPYAKDKDALEKISRESDFLNDLKVSSSRLVDIILALEDRFSIEIGDREADGVVTFGNALDLVNAKRAPAAA